MSSTEVATRGHGSTLVIDEGQSYWTDRQLAVLKQLGVKDAAPQDLAVFFHQATRTGLDPFARQIYMIGRWSKSGTVQTIQTGIDGYRLIARRAADKAHESLEYDDTLWAGADGIWRDVWVEAGDPVAAKCTVYRDGKRFTAVAHWTEYVQTTKDGSPNAMWGRMGCNQLAKCAEALALRKAFPQDLSGLYVDDEMPAPNESSESSRSRQRGAINRLTEAITEQAVDAAIVADTEPVDADVEAQAEYEAQG